jgi:hypothetical protein
MVLSKAMISLYKSKVSSLPLLMPITETLIKLKSYNKKDKAQGILSALGKNNNAHIIDVNGKDTVLAIAVKSNILCYNLIDKAFLCSYEGHANKVTQLKFMDYTHDQKQDMDSINKEFFMSVAEGESSGSMWRLSKKEHNKSITSPVKLLEMSDRKFPIGLQIKQIAGYFYFATITTGIKLYGYVCNMKTKGDSLVKKVDFTVDVAKAVTKKNHHILKTDIANETEIVVFKGNQHKLDIHSITYLNDEGSPNPTVTLYEGSATNLTETTDGQKDANGEEKNGDVKMLGLEHDLINANSTKLQSGIFNGIDIDNLESNVNGTLKSKSKKQIKTGSLVAVLEQSLHANDIETITWVLSNTDLSVINQTVGGLKKSILNELMNSLIIKLQQGVQKASLLWLGTLLKLRWLDIMKFQQNIRTVHTYLCRKSKNLSKYYELQAKLQMVVDSGIAITVGTEMEVDMDEETKEPLVYQKDESDDEIDEIVDDIDLADPT